MKSLSKIRKRQIADLMSKMPQGRQLGFKKLVLYKLAEDRIIMSESQLGTFFSSGYSSVADEIITALNAVVDEMNRQESVFQKRMGEIIEGTKGKIAADAV